MPRPRVRLIQYFETGHTFANINLGRQLWLANSLVVLLHYLAVIICSFGVASLCNNETGIIVDSCV